MTCPSSGDGSRGTPSASATCSFGGSAPRRSRSTASRPSSSAKHLADQAIVCPYAETIAAMTPWDSAVGWAVLCAADDQSRRIRQHNRVAQARLF